MEQTRIIVPSCAAVALNEYCSEHGTKREPTLRAMLERHVDEQQARQPGDRLTHVSTVIWHPDMPRGRNHPSPYGSTMSIRLASGTADVARALSLHLPGQADVEGGHHDYRPRLLADAVVTAIAIHCTFTDDVLDGLPPLLTHRAARGLFRLAVAATATRPERMIYARADADLDRVESSGATGSPIENNRGSEHAIALATLLRSEDIAWHGPYRRTVTQHLARTLLTGDNAKEQLAQLHTRDRLGFEVQRSLLELDDTFRDGTLAEHSGWPNDYEGRGGTVVWRAERIVQREEMLEWLSTHTLDASLHPDPNPDHEHEEEQAEEQENEDEDLPAGGRRRYMLEPGWVLRAPDPWFAITRRVGDSRGRRRLGADVSSGSVLHVRSGSWDVYWPYSFITAGSPALRPVPDIRTVIAAADGRSAVEIIEFLLASTGPVPGVDMYGPVQMSAYTALALGYIDQRECDRLVDEARAATVARMQAWLDQVPEHRIDLRERLRQAMDRPAGFARIVASADYQRAVRPHWRHSVGAFHETRTMVPWPHRLSSVASEIEQGGLSTASLTWLVGAVFRRFDAVLEQSMHHAWEQASHDYRIVSIIATDPD